MNDKLVDAGELIARTLRNAGVKLVFALHGGHLEAFYRGCRQHDLTLVDFRHEATAGHAAEGYARSTGQLGVCVITAGPGYLNALPAMVNAQLDGVPALFIVGAPPLREAELNSLQGGFDQIAMASPAVKWAHRITNPERVPDLLAMAIRKATTGRRGAVLIEVPIDVMHMPVAEALVTSAAGIRTQPRPAPAASELDAALKLLRSAERPAIICGGEARFANCERPLQEFAEASGIPVFANGRAFGMLPSDHPLYGHEAANLAALQAGGHPPDVVLLLGAKLGMALGGRRPMVLPRNAKLIQVLADAGEIGRIRDIDVPIVADCGSLLEAMLAAWAGAKWPDWSNWSRHATDAKRVYERTLLEADLAGGIHPYHAARAVVEAAGPDASYILDGGECGLWTAHAIRVNRPGQYINNGYLGLLGAGMGFAIGAQLAFPDRRVVQIAGDGAVGFHLQDLDTMVRRKLPIVTVVMNNRIWGMSLHGQQLLYGDNYDAISRLSDETSYARIAEGFGCYAETVTRAGDVEAAVRRAFSSGRPAMLDVRTDPACIHPRMNVMLKSGSQEDIVIPYYESIPSRS